MKRKIKKVTALLMFLLFNSFFVLEAEAAQGTVSFGSPAYEWKAMDVCPIGVYVSSEAVIERYLICLEYDAEMLTYLNGADRVEGNLLYLEGGGTENSYKRMLHFQPIKEGNTALHVVSAEGSSSVEGEGDVANAEALELLALPNAPIAVMANEGSGLRSLEIEGAVDLEPFSEEVYEYHLQVANEVETLVLSYEAIDDAATVERSETALLEGENIVTVTVKQENVTPVVYTLYVVRKEAAKEVIPVPEEKNEIQIDTKNQENQIQEETTKQEEAKRQEDVKRNGEIKEIEPVLLAAVVLVAILSIAYVIWELVKQNKKEPEQGEEEWEDDKISVINLERTVIELKHVTMNFKLAQDEVSSLKEYLIKRLKGAHCCRTLTALNDISFEVKQSEVLGIIGTNGSGKSTLLKIIAGALRPTSGEVIADKSKVQMLTLGTGFDMELTARENVYLNGAIIGYTREYINKKFDDIVAFAELNGFMDEQMKNFSSGMVSRLGFAIATMRDAPDILILDEVLSVGDVFFKNKSEKRIREMIGSGATVLIVSHSADVILKNCDKAVWIEKGILREIGDPKEVCRAYSNMKGKG